ncbi:MULTISPECIES: glucosaminidase domain-containing protein [unclassified Empedobacter]|uniref:glucosaminidase domain-containing protein n=1 Tax=unclassified Empedobacter TaxID=2643773 RepID=UPI0025C5F54A|nr:MULTISPECIES: glucosaminidase domain-containing protein [unclassified Empedobacter]
MKKLLYVFSLVLTISTQAQESRDITYIRKHAILAVEEMQLYKVPASITLAQGLLETGGGQSKLADQANNHFGIKCKGPEEWSLDKPRIYHDDDAKGECFRKYTSVEESYRDHSKFLALRPYYKALFILDPTDYNAWANGLKKSGYATDPKYASKLISRIEKYNLDQFDKISPEEVYAKLYTLYNNQDDMMLANNSSKSKTKKESKTIKEEIALASYQPNNNSIEKNEPSVNNKTIAYETRPQNPTTRIKNHKNNIPYIVAQAGETIATISKTYNKVPSDIANFNEIQMGSKLKDGQIVFFGKKKTKGSDYSYKVQEGDDMYTISQRFGVKVNNLYKLNRMEPGEQPKIGQRINLKTKVRA